MLIQRLIESWRRHQPSVLPYHKWRNNASILQTPRGLGFVFALLVAGYFLFTIAGMWRQPSPVDISATGEDVGYDPRHLFPIPLRDSWTTLPSAPAGHGSEATVTPLDYDALGVGKKTKHVVYSTIRAPGNVPQGSKAWPAFFPAGSYSPSAMPRGGLGMYIPGPVGHWWNNTAVTEVMFSYAVLFPDEFEPVRGGKLPGLC
jgi:hypothetical protein